MTLNQSLQLIDGLPRQTLVGIAIPPDAFDGIPMLSESEAAANGNALFSSVEYVVDPSLTTECRFFHDRQQWTRYRDELAREQS